MLIEYAHAGDNLYHRAVKELEEKLGRKRAKESARFFKTYASRIQCDVMFNMRSFANFLKLRNSEHAQKEIREIAHEMLELVESIEGNPFKHTIAAWKKKGTIQ
jgi:thymidylate synthase (FAD)